MGDEQRPRPGDDAATERFPCSSRIFGMVVLTALAVASVLVLMDGTSVVHWTVLAGIVLVGLGAWLTMVRPAVHAHDDHVLVRNALTDTKVPWHLIESVRVRQVLVIQTGDRAVHGLAAGRSARQQMRQERPGGRSGQSLMKASMFGGDSAARMDYADAVAQRIDHLAAKNRRKSEGLEFDKRWRSAEALAVAGVAVAFAVLLTVAIAG
jgi:hypothetical protein